MLGDLPWSGRHGCYVIFHVKLLLGRVRAPLYIYISIGCCVIIQVVVHWMLCDHPSRFRPLRSRGRIIRTSKVALFRVRGLVRPVQANDVWCRTVPIMWRNLYNLCRVS
jgi:hypothetical protein